MRVVILGIVGLWAVAMLLYTATELRMDVKKMFEPESNNDLVKNEVIQAEIEFRIAQQNFDYAIEPEFIDIANMKLKAAEIKHQAIKRRAELLRKAV